MFGFLNKNLAKKLGLKLKPISSDTAFLSAGFLTLGAEVEFQLLDSDTLNLTPRALEVLQKLSANSKIKKELFLNMIEANTAKHDNVHGIITDLTQSFSDIRKVTDEMGIKLSTTGCHPFSKYSDCVVSPSERYAELTDRNQWLAKRMTVCGLHVHIGFRSGDECINNMNFLLRFVPHFVALSASSPFWQGDDTGLTSCRPTTYEALPTAGIPYWFNSWAEFEHLYDSLKKFKSIGSVNDLWWDLRPAPKFGTLEIRICDGVATLDETAAIIAFIHLLAHWFAENSDWMTPLPPPNRWILRENKWRSLRYGLDAEIITNPLSDIKSLKADILEWTEKLRPYSDKLGYNKYLQKLINICEKGNSSNRQRSIFEKTGSLKEVAEFNVKEFQNQSPLTP